MAPGDSGSYLEQCIAALPQEKQGAARRAFQEISETGDDSYLSKLLAVLEANGAYVQKIPKDLVDAGGWLMREMATVADRLLQEEARREAWVKRAVAEEFERLGKSFPVGQIASGIALQNQVLDQLRRAASEIKSGVEGGVVVFLLIMGFMAGAIIPMWFFWGSYQDARQAKAFFDSAADAGIQLRIDPLETANRFTLISPSVKYSHIHYGDDGAANGLVIDFEKPK